MKNKGLSGLLLAVPLAGCLASAYPSADDSGASPLPRFILEAPCGTLSMLGSAGEETDARILYAHGTPGDAGNWRAFLRQPVLAMESLAIDRPGSVRARSARCQPWRIEQQPWCHISWSAWGSVPRLVQLDAIFNTSAQWTLHVVLHALGDQGSPID